MNILVLGQKEKAADIASQLLLKGYGIGQFIDPKDAIESIERCSYDLLLMVDDCKEMSRLEMIAQQCKDVDAKMYASKKSLFVFAICGKDGYERFAQAEREAPTVDAGFDEFVLDHCVHMYHALRSGGAIPLGFENIR